MEEPLELWTNLWSPFEKPSVHKSESSFLSKAQRESVGAVFGEAIKTTEGKLAIALGRSADKMSELLYVYYEPLAYLVVVLDPFAKKVSVSVNGAYWTALERQFTTATERAEALLRENRVTEALGLCIHEGCAWVTAMMKLGPP